MINFQKNIEEESYKDMTDDELVKEYDGNIKKKWRTVARQLVYDVSGPSGPRTTIGGK